MTYRLPSKRGFTLTELLVVIAIVGLMLALLIPNFSGFGRTAKLSSAVNQLRATLSLARQWAITRRETTWVVFPTDNSSLYSGGNKSEYSGKAFRSYNVYGEKSQYLREWTYLPEGTVFLYDTSVLSNEVKASASDMGTNNLLSPNLSSSVKDARFAAPFPYNTSLPSNTMPAVVFYADGTCFHGGTSPQILITEGWLSDTNYPGAIGPNSFTFRQASQRMMYAVRVYGLTGRLKVIDFRDI